jgi:SAM-dependent methyltransferase
MRAALSGVVTWFGSFGDGRARAGPRAAAEPPPRARLAAAEPAPEPQADPPGVWTPRRVRFAASLWGEGFLSPGGEEEALRLCKPLGLQESHSLLILGAGLGGPARAITSAWGTWVTGFERDPELAAAGEALSRKAKVEKKAEIRPYDPAAPSFRPNYFHHALVQEELWTVEDKPRLLEAVATALKPGGQLVMTDLTLGAAGLSFEDETARAWARLDRSPAHLEPAEEQTGLLARNGFDVRIAEEISARQVQQAVAAWREMVDLLVAQPPTRAQALTVIQEAELWLRRLALLRSGRLRLMRWHAIRR